MTNLLVSAFTPVLSTGQGLRTYGIVKALASDGVLDLLYADFGSDEPADEYRTMPGVELHRISPSRRLRRLTSYSRALANGVPDDFARGVSWELTQAAVRLASDPGRGRVIADGPVAGAALLRLAEKRPVTYNAHNFESGFRHLIAPTSDRSRRRLEKFELHLLEAADEVWMASPADAAAARDMAPGAHVRYVPNVVDTTRIAPVAGSHSSPTVLFVGDFRYPPNREGLVYLIEQVLPLLWSRIPEAELAVVGRGLEETPSTDPRISYRGFVRDLESAYAEAGCVAIPLLSGGGSPLKFIEALAYGSAVVATPRAAAGIEGVPGRDYLEASDPTGFAEAIAMVLRGESAELGGHARELAERNYSIESLQDRLLAP